LDHQLYPAFPLPYYTCRENETADSLAWKPWKTHALSNCLLLPFQEALKKESEIDLEEN